MKRTNVSDMIYSYLKTSFVNGDIDFGEKFVEITYADKLEVSRTPLREAIKRLEHEGLILRMQNGRLRFLDITAKDIDDIFDVKLALENMLIEKSINNKNILIKLKESVTRSKKLLENDELSLVKENIPQFTKILYSNVDLEYLVNLLNKNNVLINKLKRKTLITKECLLAVVSEHEAICEAIENNDVELALETNKMHLQHTKNTILKNFEN